jgi:hypothetical protein
MNIIEPVNELCRAEIERQNSKTDVAIHQIRRMSGSEIYQNLLVASDESFQQVHRYTKYLRDMQAVDIYIY